MRSIYFIISLTSILTYWCLILLLPVQEEMLKRQIKEAKSDTPQCIAVRHVPKKQP